jgi:glutaminyl-peptide cyclotransferase
LPINLLNMRKLLFPFILVIFFTACNNNNDNPDTVTAAAEAEPPRIGFTVVNIYPHDTSFFTEGLEFHDGQLYESSGSGSGGKDEKPSYPSAFGVVNLKTGKVDKKVELDNTVYFGEGITFLNGKVYQLTYTTEKGFVYDAKTFKKLHEFYYPGQGWALTHDSTHIIMSTGSSNLLFIDPAKIGDTMKAQSILGVSDNNGPVSNINELEYINGFIYANQWETNYILKIDPATGKVVGKMDLDSIDAEVRKKYDKANVLNGIAYNPATNSLFVTGKLWPSIYEIKFN